MTTGTESWCGTLKKFILKEKEARIFFHKIPIRHWLMTASRTINSLAPQACPAYRTSASTGKKGKKNKSGRVKVVSLAAATSTV